MKDFSHFRPILSFSVILNLFQDLIGILKQVQHDKMGRFLIAFIPKLTFQPFTHSTIQLSSRFTLHSSLSRPPPHPDPQPFGIQSHSARSSPVRTNIPQGERELFSETNPSPVQLFNHSTLLTLHFRPILSS